MRDHHSQGLEGWCCCEELRGLVGVELLGHPAASDNWAGFVTFVKVHPFALERGFAGAAAAQGGRNHVPDLPVVHEAELLLARGAREFWRERLIGDGVPVLRCVLFEARFLILHARLLFLWLHAAGIFNHAARARDTNVTHEPGAWFFLQLSDARLQFCTIGRECSRNLLRGNCLRGRLVCPAHTLWGQRRLGDACPRYWPRRVLLGPPRGLGLFELTEY